MPSVSKKQHNFMAAIAKNPAFAKKVGMKPSVGEHFLNADKGKKFGSGGMKKMRKFAEGGLEDSTHEGVMEAALKAGMGRKAPKLPGEDIERTYENPVTKKIKDVAKDVGKYVMGMPGAVGTGARRSAVNSMKKGGMAHSEKGEMKKDLAQDKKMVKKAVGMHDKQQHGGKKTNLSTLKKGGKVCMARGGGIEIKGKTKGTMIKMKGC
jgi:hypothetical protein